MTTDATASAEAATTFHDKLLAVQKECHALNLTPEATGQVQSRNYKYLTIGKLHAAVLPILYEHELTWTTFPTTIGDGIPALNYSLSDGEDSVEDTVPLVGCSDMQKLGSAITYARRYVLLAVLGLTPDEDDDGSAASTRNTTPATPVMDTAESVQSDARAPAPVIPIDRAHSILHLAEKAGLASVRNGTVTFKPVLKAKLVHMGLTTNRLTHLNVDNAEEMETFLKKEIEAK